MKMEGGKWWDELRGRMHITRESHNVCLRVVITVGRSVYSISIAIAICICCRMVSRKDNRMELA